MESSQTKGRKHSTVMLNTLKLYSMAMSESVMVNKCCHAARHDESWCDLFQWSLALRDGLALDASVLVIVLE